MNVTNQPTNHPLISPLLCPDISTDARRGVHGGLYILYTCITRSTPSSNVSYSSVCISTYYIRHVATRPNRTLMEPDISKQYSTKLHTDSNE